MRSGLLLLATLTLLGCAGVDTPRPRYTRADDSKTLRLRHMRLWTNGGHPLWLEVRLPRTTERQPTTNIELVFTTTISPEPRFGECHRAVIGAAPGGVTIDNVRYARTRMQLEAELGTGGDHYIEKGIVEDVYVSLSAARLGELVSGGDELAASVCKHGIRFEPWHLRQIQRLLRDGQPESAAASARASTMLSSIEQ